MLAFLQDNWLNIVVIAIISLIVFFNIRSIVKNKKAGKTVCGGDCSNCGHNCSHKC